MNRIVLFGAGAAGGYALKHLRSKGIEPLAIVDNRAAKWGTIIPGNTCRDGISGIRIMDPESAHEKYPDAEWVACAISRPAATEIRAQMKAMGVKTKPLWECLPVCHGVPSRDVIDELVALSSDFYTKRELVDQWHFRCAPDYARQDAPFNMQDIYFPDFIAHRDDEHYVDCGAADGDTVAEFRKRWASYAKITAFEPDQENYWALMASVFDDERNHGVKAAVSDFTGQMVFTAAGDYSSHLGGDDANTTTCVYRLDDVLVAPTYIKMDIEGSELEALWGARRILKEHSPVLAICAYHTSDHLWQIPLLIHAIQPDYKLFLRRYAEGAFELVWYAVPPERVQ